MHLHADSLTWLAGSNVVSVAEHVVMQILALVRNYMVGYTQARPLFLAAACCLWQYC